MKSHKTIFLLSVALSILVIFVSCIGIFTPGFYAKESFNWQMQSKGQDIIDLLVIVPVLLISSLFAYRERTIAILIWAGSVSYITYTFIIYCFSVHFNQLFVLYCFTLGLSLYSLLCFFYSVIKTKAVIETSNKSIVRITGIYFIIVSGAFYFLWLSEIIPAISANSTPESLIATGLFTNPVHVLDLAVFLPAIFITGLLLLKGNYLGTILAPAMLTFFILMDITIAWLAYEMKQKGLTPNLSAAIAMIALALFSFLLLILNNKNIKIKMIL